jgi:hypothetical protein
MAKPMEPMPPVRVAQQIANYVEFLQSIYGVVSDKRAESAAGELLMAHMVKAEGSAEAVLLLGQHYHVEEIAILNRTLSEIVVNACYLLVAEDLEVERFMKFDFIKAISRTEKLRHHVPNPVEHEPGLVEAITKFSADARDTIRRSEKDNSWSQRSLEQRADFAEQHWKRAKFKTLVLAEGVAGHSAVHATLHSLRWSIQVVAGMVSEPDEERSRGLGVVLHGTAFALLTLSIALDERFSLGLSDKLAQLDRAS